MKNTRILFLTLLAFVLSTLPFTGKGQNEKSQGEKANVALLAKATGSERNGASVNGLNDGRIPNTVSASMRQRYATANTKRSQQHLTTQWVVYEWNDPVTIDEMTIYWYNFDNLVRLPQAYRLKYWDGKDFIPVNNAIGLGLVNNQYNSTTFSAVTTTRLKLEMDSVDRFTSPILEWKVFKTVNSPDVAPVVNAGIDRDVMAGGKTYLSANIKTVEPLKNTMWSATGPARVQFSDPEALTTTASFTVPGNYLLTLSTQAGTAKASASLKAKVVNKPMDKRLDVVYTKRYKIDNPLWNDRAKALITKWIPWCVSQIERTDLKIGQGGLDNFIEAAKALRGEPHAKHVGYVFSNAWVHQTVESMCIALMVDPQGDKEIIAAQEKMKQTLEKWIPIILAAQEPDGYLQTAYTLRDTTRWKERWTPQSRGNHEGYTAGYFIESAINHYTLTEGKDKRLYNAAKKLADCWVANIGPGKKYWYDGHQEMEQALVRFGRFVNDVEGNGKGNSYIALAKFLLDNRKNGSEYDQSHVPVQQQYEAVGHAVRAMYTYSGMADVAAETGDIDYQSAVMSLWDNMVNKKYYVTGGVGSGETSEGFGGDYSLPNDAYCESCSSCGLIFFQYKMNLAYHDAKYADLYEETMYNALLGSIDYTGTNFCYTNELTGFEPRYPWHVCPCCVGNIPRTLLMVPTWSYVKSDDGIYVNLYIGSTINIEKVAGTDVEMIQKTDYPWKGDVAITVNPKQTRQFTVYVRVPNRSTSELYTTVPEVKSLKTLTVNGRPIPMKVEHGYIAIKREWKRGDKINFLIPMEIQKITADNKIEADRGRLALRYGPLIYNVEKADQPNIDQAIGNAPMKLEWRPDLFNGIMTIKGQWADGSPLVAIPNYIRSNRIDTTAQSDKTPSSIVWIKK
ncbi:MAG: glycoside hydrolase family 127 protein [Bacteroidota bacterium]|nr:glycoside hydrolase family 127 protein [Bacteroidota bacterium]